MTPEVLPRPARWEPTGGSTHPGTPDVRVVGAPAPAAVARLVDRWPTSTGGPRLPVTLVVERAVDRPVLGDDESHAIDLDRDGVVIRAPTSRGALWAVETLLQLAHTGALPHGRIVDAPAHPWRGLMLDVCRHWMPVARVLETLDAMAAAKLDVLHLHLSDDHAFRVEVTSHPRLHEVGSGGRWYRPEDLARLVGHAAELGIRVVPEIDLPGHTTSWLVAYPELAATDGPFHLRTTAGIATAALDPTSPHVRDVVRDVLTEVTAHFPDDYLHVGGDEVAPEAWPGLDAAAAQADFTVWLVEVVRSLGRTPVVWDDAWHPDLPAGVVTQVWRGHRRLRAVADRGGPALYSAPYYLDLSYDPRHLHVSPLADGRRAATERAALLEDPSLGTWRPLVAHTLAEWDAATDDPVPEEVEAAAVLGGEVCHWTELTTADSLHLRTWPAAAAAAEALWSGEAPGSDLHARLDRFALHLAATTSVDPEGDRRARWLELAGGDPDLAAAVAALARCCEPQKWYARHALLPDGRIDLPFDGFVDALPPAATDVLALGAGAPIDEVVGRWRAAATTVRSAPNPSEGPDPLATARAVAEVVDRLCRGEVPPEPVQVGEVIVTASVPLATAGWRP